MKQKKFKLSLNKQTVSNLAHQEMVSVKAGGESQTYCNWECIDTDPDTQHICITWIGGCVTDFC